MGVRLRAALPWVLLFVGLALGVTAFRRRHVIVRNTTDLPVGIDIRISDLRSGVLTIPPGERRIVAINGFVTEDASMLVHIGGTKVASCGYEGASAIASDYVVWIVRDEGGRWGAMCEQLPAVTVFAHNQ